MRNLLQLDAALSRLHRIGVPLLCAALLAACGKEPPRQVPGGDAEQGLRLVTQYQCGACHEIPQVPGARGTAGPTLEHVGRISYIAAGFPNQPETMVRWLRDPPGMKPGTKMPVLGITETEARHMAAFLYTLQ